MARSHSEAAATEAEKNLLDNATPIDKLRVVPAASAFGTASCSFRQETVDRAAGKPSLDRVLN